MYFWKIDKLKADLIERPATEREALPYLIATYLIWVMSMYTNLPTDFGLKFFIALFVSLFGTGYGTYWLYKINDTKPNNFFLQRFVMMGWVVMIRYIVIFCIPLVLLISILNAAGLGPIDPKTTSWSDIIANLVTYIVYYWYCAKHLTEVTQKAQY